MRHAKNGALQHEWRISLARAWMPKDDGPRTDGPEDGDGTHRATRPDAPTISRKRSGARPLVGDPA